MKFWLTLTFTLFLTSNTYSIINLGRFPLVNIKIKAGQVGTEEVSPLFVDADQPKNVIDEKAFFEIRGNILSNKNDWPGTFTYQNQELIIDYTIDEELTRKIKGVVEVYRPDYAAVVVIDNKTGGVKVAFDYSRQDRQFSKDLVFSSSHPAASIFKVVTAATLVEHAHRDENSLFAFNGNPHTLYQRQLKEQKRSKIISLGEAFAKSNNVVFGKAAIDELSGDVIKNVAEQFLFERKIFLDLPVPHSQLMLPQTSFQLAEMASGFNTETTMSPLHGAVMAHIISNQGVLKSPHFIKSIRIKDQVKPIYEVQEESRQALNPEVASNLKTMMGLTLIEGTAKRNFKKYALGSDLVMGGKTGSITGGMPYGKRDWFISYAHSTEPGDEGISICIMLINQRKWYIKSPYLAKRIVQYYYNQNE